eukprot:15447736-Alexandrium_andersonii.AAC.1
MFADDTHKTPFCVPEAKAALADLWTHSVSCVEQMRALVQQRAAESSTVPLSETVPHSVGTVGKGNRIDRFVHTKTCAMLTACGTKPWAEHALR